ncbi:MAG: hypothetical protein ABJP48_08460 [Erythrobacter sp.]
MLIRTIEKFLREHDMPATKFGRLAAHDPRFVLDLRMGRIPRSATEKRTQRWMEEYAEGQTQRAEFKAAPGSFIPKANRATTPEITATSASATALKNGQGVRDAA